jgi:hypothetical protein
MVTCEWWTTSLTDPHGTQQCPGLCGPR